MNSAGVQMKTIHMSIGCDCAVAYQLRKQKLVEEAFPFDWAKIDKIQMLCDVLEIDFSIFFENYVLKNQSDNFDKFVDFNNFADTDTDNVKSKIKMILKNKIIFPHEADEDIFDFEKFKQKYLRRITRFNNVVRNNDIKKIFVRADNTHISESDKIKLDLCLRKYGCVNFEIKFITYSDYICIGEFNWKRDYIDWEKIFI